MRVLWPEGEGVAEVQSNRTYLLTDQRNWISGLHGGGRSVCESTIPAERFAAAGNGDAQARGGKSGMTVQESRPAAEVAHVDAEASDGAWQRGHSEFPALGRLQAPDEPPRVRRRIRHGTASSPASSESWRRSPSA